MKFNFIFFPFLFCYVFLKAQSPITGVTVTMDNSNTSNTYTIGSFTYNWAMDVNNLPQILGGINAVSGNYNPLNRAGKVKLRRFPTSSPSINLQWNEGTLGTNTYNIFTGFNSDEEFFLTDNAFNKGAENLFDNTTKINNNVNNIERFDWILTNPYYSTNPTKTGFTIFERGLKGDHDAFYIAAITSLTNGINGDPKTYGPIKHIMSSNYGDPEALINSLVLAGPETNNLSYISTSTENRGGVFVTLDDLGISSGVNIYGYSIFANDLPASAQPINLVDYTNTTYFPQTTSATDGGLDLIAITALYNRTTVLPTRFTSFNATKINELIKLSWRVENESSVDNYILQRSADGKNFNNVQTINSTVNSTGLNMYSFVDDISSLKSAILYYRVKQSGQDGAYYFSKSIAVGNNTKVELRLYPNPTSDNLIINISSQKNDKATITICNVEGVKVSAQDVALIKGNNSYTINTINKLTKGIYQMLIIYESGEIKTRQFIKK